jgi:hypothetical protein
MMNLVHQLFTVNASKRFDLYGSKSTQYPSLTLGWLGVF